MTDAGSEYMRRLDLWLVMPDGPEADAEADRLDDLWRLLTPEDVQEIRAVPPNVHAASERGNE